MANEFDFASLAQEVAAPPPADMAETQPEFDFAKLAQDAGSLLDEATGEPLPSHATGLTPDSALNRPLLGFEARMKMSFGNDKGNEKFLKERFEDAQKDKNGDWVVKADDRWYRVDGKTFTEKDPWQLAKDVVNGKTRLGDALDVATREPLGDVADIYQEGSIALASSIAALMTGGQSLKAQLAYGGLAGGAAKAATTSLGRIMGTYDATLEEQLQDIAFEGVLNAGGIGLAHGVSKVGAPMIKKWASGMKNLPEASANVIRKVWSTVSGIGEESIDFAIKNSDDVGRAATAINAAGSKAEDAAKTAMIDAVEELTKQAQPTLSAAWKNISDDLVRSVPEGQVLQAAKASNELFADALEKGIGTFTKKQGGKVIRLKPDEIPGIIEGLRSGKAPAKGWNFKLKSIDELSTMAQRGQTGFEIASNAEAYQALNQFYTDTWRAFGRTRPQAGAKGMKQLMNLHKSVGDRTFSLSQMGDREGLSVLKTLSAELDAKVTQVTKNLMDDVGVGSRFAELEGLYSQGKKEFGTLLKAAKSARNGAPEVLETMTNRLTAASGRNVTQKTGVDALIDFAQNHAPAHANALKQAQHKFMSYKAAADFNPILRKGLISTTGVAGGAGSLLAGNPVGAAIAGTALTVTSPKASRLGTKIIATGLNATAKAQNAQLVQTLASSKPAQQAMLALRRASHIAGSRAHNFFKDPNMLIPFTEAFMQLPEAKAQVDALIGIRGEANGSR